MCITATKSQVHSDHPEVREPQFNHTNSKEDPYHCRYVSPRVFGNYFVQDVLLYPLDQTGILFRRMMYIMEDGPDQFQVLLQELLIAMLTRHLLSPVFTSAQATFPASRRQAFTSFQNLDAHAVGCSLAVLEYTYSFSYLSSITYRTS